MMGRGDGMNSTLELTMLLTGGTTGLRGTSVASTTEFAAQRTWPGLSELSS